MTPARVTRFALLGTRGHAQRVAAPALRAFPQDTLSGASVITRQGAEPEAFGAVGMLDTYRASIADFIAAVHGQPHIGADGQTGIAVAAITEAAMICGVGASRPGTTHQGVQHEQAR